MPETDLLQPFELVAERAPVMLWMGDRNGKCLYLNAAQRNFWGVEPQALKAFDWVTTIHADDLDGLFAAVGPAMEAGAPFDVEARYRRYDGVYRTLRTKGEPRFDSEGKFVGMIGVNEDVTDQREAEKAVSAKSHIAEVLNQTGASIAAEIDLDRLVQLVTDAAVELTGAQFGAFFYNVLNETGESYMLYTLSGVARSAFDNFPMPRATKIFQPTFRGEEIIRSDDILSDHRYGQNVPHRGMPPGHLPVRSYLAVPVRSRSGDVIGGLFFGHEEVGRFTQDHEVLISGLAGQAATAIDNARLFQAKEQELQARKQAESALLNLNSTLEIRIEQELEARMRAEEAMRHSQKLEAIGQLTGGVAHDFNNLLMAVLGSLELAKKRLPDDPQLRKFFENAVLGAKRGATLTQRMLSFARRHPIDPKPTKLGDLVSDMVELLQSTIGAQIVINTWIPPTTPAVVADRNQLETALINLAVNARDAMPKGGLLTIQAQQCHLNEANPEGLPPGDYVCLEVADQGEGMDETTLSKAREPFFTTKGVGKGTGLGLSMVHGMAEQVGGRLVLNSKIGHGTTARIFFRIAYGDEKKEPDDFASPIRPIKTLRVLAVDDDPLVLLNTVAMLQDMGHSVVEANSATDAIEQCQSESFDLLLTDHIMPKTTGLELIHQLRARWPKLPAVLTSGYAEVAKDLSPGVFKLDKPFKQSELAEALRKVTEVRS